MDILGIGFAELIFIFLIAMMVFGPRRLPEIAAKAGKFVADLRNMSQGLLTEWQREIAVAGRLEELKQAREDIEAIKQDLAQAKVELGQAQKDIVTTTKTVSSDLKTVSSELKAAPAELAAAASSSSEKPAAEVKPKSSQPEKAVEEKIEEGAEDDLHSPASSASQEETTAVMAVPETGPSQESPAAKPAPATEAQPAEPPQTDIQPKVEDTNHRHEAPAAGSDEVSTNPAVDTTNGAAASSAEASEPAVDLKKKEAVNE